MAGQPADPTPPPGALVPAGPSATVPGQHIPVAATSAAPAEMVARPEPGLARGVWEAPPWAFWAVLGVVLVGSILYVLHRAGVIRLTRASSRGPST